MKKRVLGLVVIEIIFLSIFVGATFQFSDEEIDTNYLAEDYVRGQVYMNFSNEPNSNFTSNFAGGISLIDLLEGMGKRAGRDFSCSPVICMKHYLDDGNHGRENRDFTVVGSKTLGVKIIANNFGGIGSFNFKVEGRNVPESCQNQIAFDVLNDGELEFVNNGYSIGGVCGEKNYGCYLNNTSQAT